MADVKWIKIATDIFDNRKIKQIESMPDGDSLIVIWFKLICLAGNVNDGGIIYLTKEIPYTEEMLATQFNKPITNVRLALKTFESFEMIEIVNHFIYLSNWEKYQNTDKLDEIRKQTRQRVAKYREKKKEIEGGNVTSNGNVTLRNATDKDIEEDKDIINININNNMLKNASNDWTIEEQFAYFWEYYPQKKAKKTAFDAFKKAIKKVALEELVMAVERHKRSSEWKASKGKYIPYPATWLNGERWLDDVAEEERNSNDTDSRTFRANERATETTERFGKFV